MSFLSNLVTSVGRASPSAVQSYTGKPKEERDRIASALGKLLAGDQVTSDRVVVTGASKAAASPVESNPFGEFFTSLVGGRPEGGFQDNGVQGAANYLRYLVGHGDAGVAYRDRIGGIQGGEAAYDRTKAADELQQYGSMLPEDEAKFSARQALMDPAYMQQQQAALQSGIKTQGAQGDLDYTQGGRAAIQSGDIDQIRRFDPALADKLVAAQEERRLAADAERRGAQLRQLQGIAQTPMGKQDFGAAVAAVAAQNPGMFDDQTIAMAKQGGYDAVSRALAGAPEIQSIMQGAGGNQFAVGADGTVQELDLPPDQLARALMQAQIAAARFRATPKAVDTASKTDALRRLEGGVSSIEALIDEGEQNGAFIKAGTRPEQAAYIRAMNAAQGAMNPAHPPKQTVDKMKSAVSSTMGALRQLYAASGSAVSSRMMDTEKEWERIAAEVFVEGASADALRYAITNFRNSYLAPTIAELNANTNPGDQVQPAGTAPTPQAAQQPMSFADFMSN